MTIDTETCNLALSHLGDGTLLTDPLTEKSEQAICARTFFPTALKYTLKQFDWGSHRKYLALSLVEENPNAEWKYSYRYPSDCVQARKIVSGIRNPRDDQKIPYAIGSDDVGQLIFTDMYQATLRYTYLNDEGDTWDLDFKLAVSYFLAYLMAARLKTNNASKIKSEMASQFISSINQAKANSANQEEEGPQIESELEASRN